ncbi:MAG: D-tyrosyl-tRNA(Tyr) deacylase [Saprospiraceae bacterium]|nr:D-tyrosyl-tRNA(Tyr) deacylase [Candidatus Defluviibacterium haderslevense]MBK7242940.1 D-tyrosyl-tRNA(Tyr) deacylase [Candidatus Defluviibacterium haderslevense]
MRVIIQRVNYTEISINNNVHSSISKGLLLLLGIEETDTPNDIDWLINKILHLRIFSDENALMNLSILDVQGDIMVVSQFTLFASTKKGTRPGFTRAAKPDFAKTIYHDFLDKIRLKCKLNIQSGLFGMDMQLKLLNNGPVTIFIDTKNKE